jgi:hypothetical protein
MKTMSIRLEESQKTELELVAAADGQAMNDTIRNALDEYIEKRRKDAEFQERLQAIVKRNAIALERLGK